MASHYFFLFQIVEYKVTSIDWL